MTRKKWNRLRKQRPELFAPFGKTAAWEQLEIPTVKNIRRLSKAEVVGALAEYIFQNC